MLTNTRVTTSTAVITNKDNNKHGKNLMRETKVFGFWIYLMSDCILFACLFATYAVLSNSTAGGPSGKEIFQLKFVLLETFLLLLSSINYGMAMLALPKGKIPIINRWLSLTFLFGFLFVLMETYELHHLINKDFTPDHSAFLSSFFVLISTHGLHVTLGLLWMGIVMIQINQRGLTLTNKIRLMCLSLFWHFLDIIWIFVFSMVYLLGFLS